jgi:hypothetical protein
MGRPVKPVIIPLGSSHPPPRPPLQSPWDAWEGDVSSGGSEIFSLAHLEAAVPTLTTFMQDFYLPYVKLRKRTWAKDEELFRLRLKKAFNRFRPFTQGSRRKAWRRPHPTIT